MSEPDLMDAWYFQRDAEIMIKLQEYIIANDIEEENLEDATVLTAMLRASVRKYAGSTPVTPELLNKFKEVIKATVCPFQMFKTVHLYLMPIIAIVACVEHVLYRNGDKEEYEKLYRGDKQKAIEAYNKLCGFPADKIPKESKLEQVLSVFTCPEFFNVNSPLEAIRSYLENINLHPIYREQIKRRIIDLTNGYEL
uniref:Uncharacterized protein n=1 Tax=Trichogramma kaykai TaxID=54128 RepID=A0ABD2XCD2_9HYME